MVPGSIGVPSCGPEVNIRCKDDTVIEMRRIMTLVEAESSNLLRDLVVRLDGLLTGRPVEAARNAQQRSYLFADPITFVMEIGQDAYYLADGGYSRLMADEEGVRGLSSVSRQEVKDRWHDPDVQKIVQDLDQLLRDAIDNAS
jgi:hypothetical protein